VDAVIIANAVDKLEASPLTANALRIQISNGVLARTGLTAVRMELLKDRVKSKLEDTLRLMGN